MIGKVQVTSDWDGVTRRYDPTLEEGIGMLTDDQYRCQVRRVQTRMDAPEADVLMSCGHVYQLAYSTIPTVGEWLTCWQCARKEQAIWALDPAIRARLEAVTGGGGRWLVEWRADVAAALTVIDAQARRLVEVEAERDQARRERADAKLETIAAQTQIRALENMLEGRDNTIAGLRARATRLAALEQAAGPVAAFLFAHPEWWDENGHGCKLCHGANDDARTQIEHDADCPLPAFLAATLGGGAHD